MEVAFHLFLLLSQGRENQCKFYGFMDDELPSEYYKELFFKEHEELKMLRWRVAELCANDKGGPKSDEGKCCTFDEASYVQMLELKAELKEELSFIRSKVNSHDKLVALFALFGILVIFVAAKNVFA